MSNIAKPIKEKLRRFSHEKKETVRLESGPALSCRLLLKKCKDPFGLPRISEVVDSTAGCELLCFLDYYSGYHQISPREEDQIKMFFITPFGAYCYMTMSFGLKNAGATCQRAI
jgi:hypothetical protein